MNVIKRLYKKVYYNFADFILRKTPLKTPDYLENTINIFLYFDYEREFGGHETSISNKDINRLLSILEEHQIKTTWFTVGKIFDKYPESITAIINKGHEIGSHTYSHIPPYYSSKKNLGTDFSNFSLVSSEFAAIRGFHSPNGAWSLNNFKYYAKYNFTYDVISCKKSKIEKTLKLKLKRDKSLIRFQTIGDDWDLYKSNFNEVEVSQYFISNFENIKPGELVGMGFHPWILFSNSNIIRGFEIFLQHLSRVENKRVETANFFAESFKKSNNQ